MGNHMDLTKLIWALTDKVEQLRAEQEQLRLDTVDFGEKNYYSSAETAYMKVLYLLKHPESLT